PPILRRRWILPVIPAPAGSISTRGAMPVCGGWYEPGRPYSCALAGPARVVLRYLERVVTHDAMFRSLAWLRIWLFTGLARSAAGGLGLRRSGDVLARLVNDVDVLDGLYLRILVPLL